MSAQRHRYIVTGLHTGAPWAPDVKVGTVFVDTYRGPTHTYVLERRGEVRPLCTVVHVERYTAPAPVAGEEGT